MEGKGILKTFWAKVCNTTVYILNHQPKEEAPKPDVEVKDSWDDSSEDEAAPPKAASTCTSLGPPL